MGLESASWITDLDVNNPVQTDKKKQGDDHLRLIKAVLKACFPTASKAWYNPSTVSKTANYTVLATDMNKTILVDTSSGAVTLTLPTLAAGDAGWEISTIKTNTGTNPMFIQPASGTIQSGEIAGLSKTRRCIPGHRTRVVWTGSAWFAERVPRLPVGSIIDCPLSGLPVGYEWASGQTLASASTNYPDYNTANGSGVTRDRRGRAAFGRDDMGGSTAGRITNALSGITGTSLDAAGGAQSVDILQENLPAITFPNTLDVASQGTPIRKGTSTAQATSGSGPTFIVDGGGIESSDLQVTGGVTSGGTGVDVNKMPPAQITNMIVVVE